jgi:hypothetical protein
MEDEGSDLVKTLRGCLGIIETSSWYCSLNCLAHDLPVRLEPEHTVGFATEIDCTSTIGSVVVYEVLV